MDKEKTVSEQEIRDSISEKEERSAEIARKATIERAEISIEIAKDATRSQNQDTLSRGLDHCATFRVEMGFSKIRYSEAGSSEEEIKSLESEIIRKLSPTVMIKRLFDTLSSSDAIISIEEILAEEKDPDQE